MRGAVALSVLASLLGTSCSRNARSPLQPLSSAPVAALERHPPAPQDVEGSLDDSTALAAAEDDTSLAALEESRLEAPFGIDSPFDPEEPAISEDEVALLDELMALSLPEAPRKLSHEEALLHTRSELPLVMNEHVQRLINYFTKTSRGKATIRVSLGRGAAYRAMIERILAEEGVPAEIYYLAMAESGFRPNARSHAHATGMWQFISSRGKQYGLRRDRYLDLRLDAEASTRAAARHLKDLHIEFNDWYLAMAAYNTGPNNVKKAIRRTGSRDYWTMVKRRALHRETRNYLPIILAMTYVGQNLDLFDIGEIDSAPELSYDTVLTEGEVSFELIADATGSSVDAIRDMNQALFRSATPPYAYELRIPAGTASQYQREVALVPPDKRKQWRRYEVRQGETLEAVAHRYKVKPAELAALNSLPGGAQLAGGTRLTVPAKTRTTIYRYYGSGGRAGGLVDPGTGRYRITNGDTLGGIARRFGTSVTQLMTWNGLPSTRIRAGRYLIVKQPGTGGAVETASAGPAPAGRYTVRRGDSLSTIGTRVGATVAQLQGWNGIRGTTIHVGQRLRVPGRAPSSTPAAARASAAAPSANHYRIRRGDNLSLIAARFGVSVSDLRAWNGIRGTRITAGEYLRVRPAPEPAAGSARTRPLASARGGSSAYYTVRRGDTLGAIASRYGVTDAQLRLWNGTRGNLIFPGDRLAVNGPAAAGTAQSYRIRSGDTLAVIAKRFNVSVNDLKRWNQLTSSRIRAGNTLRIHPSGS